MSYLEPRHHFSPRQGYGRAPEDVPRLPVRVDADSLEIGTRVLHLNDEP